MTAKDSTSTGGYGHVINQLSGSDFTKGRWEKKEFNFTAKSYETYVGIVKWSENPNDHVRNSIICLDNISVRENEEYKLVWSDEFNDEELDQNTWGYELGNIRGNEQQHYSSSKDNVIVTDGNLVLKVTDRPEEDQYRNTAKHWSNARVVKYNSGSVRTQGKQEFLYGRIEARMKLPKGTGVFPAFWTLGADFHMDGRINTKQGYSWPSTGEIDIMELTGAPTEERAAQEEGKKGNSNKLVHGTPHFYYERGDADKDGSYKPYELGGTVTINEDFYDDYHVFGINWSPDKIEWYVDDVVYNTMVFKEDDARLKAAKASLNRAQYIQFNLATGGNFPGTAGDYLAVDGTELKVDWVRWYQTEEQNQAMEEYYKTSPNLIGTQNVTMIEGSETDLLDGVTTDKEGYVVDYSIDDEFMFENTGAPGGRNEVTVQVQDSTDVKGLKNLEPGVYNIHYTALPADKSISGWVTPTDQLARKTVFLTVLPKDGLTGITGNPLGTVTLPEGWEWEDATQLPGSQNEYRVIFRQVKNSGTVNGNERKLILEIPSEFITLTNITDTVSQDTYISSDTVSTVTYSTPIYISADISSGTVTTITDTSSSIDTVRVDTNSNTNTPSEADTVTSNTYAVTEIKIYADTTNHWAKEAVEFVTEKGLFKGTSENMFSPNEITTRGMIFTVLARVSGFDIPDTSSGAKWYEPGMKWAKENNVSDGTNPDAEVSREQLITMIWRLAGSPNSNYIITQFKDYDRISEYAQEALKWALDKGIIQGKGNDILDPDDQATRAEVAQIMKNYLSNK